MPVTERAESMMLRKDEVTKLVRVASCHAKLFDLADETQLQEYVRLLDKVSNKKVELRFLSRQWYNENKCVMVYAEWADYVIDKD